MPPTKPCSVVAAWMEPSIALLVRNCSKNAVGSVAATGEAKITAGYRLPARYIIHTVGPVWHGGGRHEAARLAAAYANSLRLAAAHHVRSIAFHCISTGIYGYPAKEAATIALNTVRDTLPQCPSIETVIF